jgi:hypothetical protein
MAPSANIVVIFLELDATMGNVGGVFRYGKWLGILEHKIQVLHLFIYFFYLRIASPLDPPLHKCSWECT